MGIGIDNELMDELAEVEKIAQKQSRVLCQLIDNKISQDKSVIAIRGHMGETDSQSFKAIKIPSYSAMHTLEWVGKKNILLGVEMDFMKTSIDPETGKLSIDEESAEELRQRAPDWSRQADLTTYLIQERYRKFGTILAVISPDWVDDLTSDNWGKDGRAIINSVEFEAIDSQGKIGLLKFENTKIYALDGQHRVMGIRGVFEVIEGALILRKKDGAEDQGKRVPKDFLLKKLNLTPNELNKILSETINIEYIPAVMAGETREDASRRIRSVFVAINSHAKKTSKGENILIDENDGFAIVARRIAHHQLFIDSEGVSRVNWEGSSISSSDNQHIITLQHIKDCIENYLKYMSDYDWEPLFKTVSLRPPEDQMKNVSSSIKLILDQIDQLPVFKNINAGDSIKELREFPVEKSPNNKGHLLLRPIGIPLLFEAIGMVYERSKNVDIANLFRKLSKLDSDGGFFACNPSSPWYGVTYDISNQKMILKQGNLTVAAKILSYLLVGANEKERSDLLNKVVELRTVEQTSWYNYEGERVKINYESIALFDPIKITE